MVHSELRVTEGYAYTLQESLLRDMDAIDEAMSAAVASSENGVHIEGILPEPV